MSEVFALSTAERKALAPARQRADAVLGVALNGPASERRVRGVLSRVVATMDTSQAIGQVLHAAETLVGPETLAAIRDREQAWRDVEARHGMLTSAQVAAAAGSRSKNPSEFAGNLRRTNQVVAIERAHRLQFPGFQFDDHGRPHPELRTVLNAFREAGWDAESVIFWFTAANGYLDGQEPAAQLAADPEAVLDAAFNAAHSP